MRKNSASITALLVGIALGVLGGILFAPAGGASVRNTLTYQLKKTKTKLQKLIQVLALLRAKGIVTSQAKVAGQEVVDKTVQKAQKLLAEVNALAAQLKASQ